MKDKDGFKHVENCGCSQEDLDRGYSDGMAKEQTDRDGLSMMGWPMWPEPEDRFEGGFLGRGRTWER